jgi:hypothetical protein
VAGLRAAVASVLVAGSLAVGCGKKGPPLPPIVYTPAPPGEFAAIRQANQVAIAFSVPAANTDGTRPADLQRVDVYAWTGNAAPSNAQIIRYATKVGSVQVKAPRDPNAVIDPDEPVEDMEPPEGPGLDQGATAALSDPITQASFEPLRLPAPRRQTVLAETQNPRPLVASSPPLPTRTYVAVGVTTRGRPGAFSRKVAVPLAPPPDPPGRVQVTYDETGIVVSWPAPQPVVESPPPLPSRWLGTPLRAVSYVVDEVSPTGAPSAPVRLTENPVSSGTFRDARIEWGQQRCYAVRAVELIGDLPIESALSARACVTPEDHFPPSAPAGLQAVGAEGGVSLIWTPSTASDLAGYIVLRGTTSTALSPLTQTPIPDSNFHDAVEAGVRYFYAVEAVDHAGNRSAPTEPVEEAAR